LTLASFTFTLVTLTLVAAPYHLGYLGYSQPSPGSSPGSAAEDLNTLASEIHVLANNISTIADQINTGHSSAVPPGVKIFGGAKGGIVPYSYIVRVIPNNTLSNGTAINSDTALHEAIDLRDAAVSNITEKGTFEVTHLYNNTLGRAAFAITCEACAKARPNHTTFAAISNTLGELSKVPNVLVTPDRYAVASEQQAVTPNIKRIGGTESFAKSGDGQGNVNASIAVIDTGIDCTHPDLNVVWGYDFINNTELCFDDEGHGTNVAGIAAAKDNNIGVVGVAPGANLYALKVLDGNGNGKLSTILAALDWVEANSRKIDVVNMSLELQGAANEFMLPLQSLKNKGVVVVAAAGNDADSASNYSPARYGEKKFGPDLNDNLVITVSSIADTDGKCGGTGPFVWSGFDDSFASIYSNYGPAIMFAAPGTEIFSTFKNHGYAAESGTSQATPLVAGAATLYKSLHPLANQNEVEEGLSKLAVSSQEKCSDSNGKGYFDSLTDPDRYPEKLLYIGGLNESSP
jgi:subtilisin family serine protease